MHYFCCQCECHNKFNDCHYNIFNSNSYELFNVVSLPRKPRESQHISTHNKCINLVSDNHLASKHLIQPTDL